MKNGWTGGQYSLARSVTGIYLTIHFSMLLPWGTELFSSTGVLPDGNASPLLHLFPNVLAINDSPTIVSVMLGIGVVASVLLAIGLADRVAAVALWYILAAFVGRNPLILNPALPFVGWILLWHAAMPPGPYLSWRARGRPDPSGGWRLPEPLFGAAWIVMAIGYSYSGYTKLISPSWVDGTAFARVLENPLARPSFIRDIMLSMPEQLLFLATWGALGMELLFAPMALARRIRPFIWTAMLAMHLGLIVLIDFADLSFGMVVVHLFTFDPAWISGRKATDREIVFYDGSCGLCHRAVRFILAEDRSGATFAFAPLQSETFESSIPEDQRNNLPDSVIVRTSDGTILVRSRAVLHVGQRLGGYWCVLSLFARLIPPALSDLVYDGIAAIRYKIFARPKDACPIIPKEMRERFLGT